MPRANPTESQLATSICSNPRVAKRNGATVTVNENSGVAKLIIVASRMVFFAVFWMLVSWRSVNRAFSRSAILFSCSKLSAS